MLLGTWGPPVELLAGAQEVSIGFAHACALDGDGSVHCWGDNESGQVGDGTFTRRERPVAVLTDAVTLAVGDRNTCAIRTDGTRWCWGEWIGRTPVEVDAPGLDARMSRGLGADCLASAGSLLCRGSNLWGQIGDGTVEYRTDYVAVDADDVIDVTQQWTHTCALDAQGGVWCWRDNADAQIGDGSPPGMVVRPTAAP
jgi:alpha-tubulin suppressor-like RCC1 family protein